MTRRARTFFFLLCCCALTALSGCRRETSAAKEAVGPKEVRHALRGEILEVHAKDGVLVVHHEEIPGYMPAMTMEFAANAGDVANARPGQRIRADLVQRGDEFSLEQIWPDDVPVAGKLDAAARDLVQDTVSKGRGAYREIGEEIPNFTLLDQEGRVVESGRFRGKQVLFNFIFTRCPVATMCPASVAKFQQVQREARERGVKNFELVSISLDPTYDTPGVLREYVTQRAIDTSNYTFLTGPDQAIRSLLRQFGVQTDFSGKLATHTLATVLVSPDGRIVHRADGSAWTAREFIERLNRD
ncbi:SCO family protein [Nibricoccus sp. IMCC34717]|uniref:SCO family protein n=1 Tax=Nibricoccus sp. IMCC34717 TaxID=3034021 RepID=UPI00385091D9